MIEIAQATLERVWPDLTIILDVDLETAAGRLKRDLDRMERKGDGYHSRVRAGFLKLADQRPGFAVVDARGSIEATQHQIRAAVQRQLG